MIGHLEVYDLKLQPLLLYTYGHQRHFHLHIPVQFMQKKGFMDY